MGRLGHEKTLRDLDQKYKERLIDEKLEGVEIKEPHEKGRLG